MRRILILCKSALGSSMSSPGIRAYNIARVLAAAMPESEITLGVEGPYDTTGEDGFAIVDASAANARSLVQASDVIITQGLPTRCLDLLPGRLLVLDFFTNFMVEGLEYRTGRISSGQRAAWLETQRCYLNLQLTLADFVICANERQRDAWLGMLSNLGLITGDVYDRDNRLRRLVDVCPYGVRPEPPVQRRKVLKGAYPGIGANDRVILWNGGIVRYYDPRTLLLAFQKLLPANPDLKLLFLGSRYPVKGFDIGDTLGDAIALARESGLLDRAVFFNDGWIPYEESGEYMLEADVGVSTYYDNLESHFSFRTRLVDCIWAQLPFVCTRGDVLAALVEQRGLGLTVPACDVPALTTALDRLLNDAELGSDCRRNLAALSAEMSWETQLAPLVCWLREAKPAAQSRLARTPVTVLRASQYLLARSLEAGRQRLIAR